MGPCGIRDLPTDMSRSRCHCTRKDARNVASVGSRVEVRISSRLPWRLLTSTRTSGSSPASQGSARSPAPGCSPRPAMTGLASPTPKGSRPTPGPPPSPAPAANLRRLAPACQKPARLAPACQEPAPRFHRLPLGRRPHRLTRRQSALRPAQSRRKPPRRRPAQPLRPPPQRPASMPDHRPALRRGHRLPPTRTT